MLKESGKIWKEVIADAKRLYGITITKSGGQKIMKKFKNTGSVADMARSGWPKKLTPRVNRTIKR